MRVKLHRAFWLVLLVTFVVAPVGLHASLTPEKLYQKVLPSVMTLEVESQSGERFIGSAVLAMADDVAVTAWHVVANARTVWAVFADGQRLKVIGCIHQDALRDLLGEAVRLEDGLAYDEPSDWFFPVRHVLGAELLSAGVPREAERIYRDELKLQPRDGWALRGLAQALGTEGQSAAARAAELQFRQAWKHATVSISTSAF